MIGLVERYVKAALFRVDNRVAFWTILLKVLEEESPEFGLSAEQASVRRVRRRWCAQDVCCSTAAMMNNAPDDEEGKSSNRRKKRVRKRRPEQSAHAKQHREQAKARIMSAGKESRDARSGNCTWPLRFSFRQRETGMAGEQHLGGNLLPVVCAKWGRPIRGGHNLPILKLIRC